MGAGSLTLCENLCWWWLKGEALIDQAIQAAAAAKRLLTLRSAAWSLPVPTPPGSQHQFPQQQAVEKGQKFAREDDAETSQNQGSALEEIPR
jgi:hypothetical protein